MDKFKVKEDPSNSQLGPLECTVRHGHRAVAARSGLDAEARVDGGKETGNHQLCRVASLLRLNQEIK